MATTLALSHADVSAQLRSLVQRRFGVRYSVLTSTGRAGLTLLLRALRQLAPVDRDEVVLPTYTCYSVAASVVKAGLRPRLVDICPDTLDYDAEAIHRAEFTRVLAIVATNLYGIPNDLRRLGDIARSHGAFLVDDAAQAMGGTLDDRWSGTWGDAGLFSLDKGKNVSAIDGGIVVTNRDDVAEVLRREIDGLVAPGLGHSVTAAAKAMVYSLFLRPSLYWIPNNVPQLSLGKTVFTTEYPLERPDPALTALAVRMLPRLDEFTRARQANAATLMMGLSRVPDLQPIAVPSGASAVYLRLPVLVRDSASRDRAIARLTGEGVGATGSYPRSLADVEPLRRYLANPSPLAAGGRDVASRILTLPTHPFVTRRDASHIVDILSNQDRRSSMDVLASDRSHVKTP